MAKTREPTMAEIRAKLKYIRNSFGKECGMLYWAFDLILFAFKPIPLDDDKKKDDKVKKLHNKTRKG